ncbi:MAG: PSP1 domain-containing protein, partial [Phycisphaerales bacterium]
MAILPLPQFEADLLADQEAYAKLKPPTSIVVRFGVVRMVGEFAYDGEAKPGCGSKLVARTHRGTELCEMLTSTCPNAGCSKSVSRREMLEYIDNSGGRDYPFFTDGRILRVATVEDMNKQASLDSAKLGHIKLARRCVEDLALPMKIVDAEELLGGERLTFYFTPTRDEHARVDFRPLVMELAHHYRTRIEMRQVGARDEARINADYEKCGQHCCCKQFLKVLKPVSMKNAKIQKATLDPLKISGRCGRLMCCLRYEESTYDDLRKRLPRKKSPIMTPDGPGIVIDSQILTQLVLVRLDATNEDAAYPLENLGPPESAPQKVAGPDAGDEPDENDSAPSVATEGPSGGLPPGPALPRGDRPGATREPGPRDSREGGRGSGQEAPRPAPGGDRSRGGRPPGGREGRPGGDGRGGREGRPPQPPGARDGRGQDNPRQGQGPRQGPGPGPSQGQGQCQDRRDGGGQPRGGDGRSGRGPGQPGAGEGGGQEPRQGQNQRGQNLRGTDQRRQVESGQGQNRPAREGPGRGGPPGTRPDAWPSNMGPPPQ